VSQFKNMSEKIVITNNKQRGKGRKPRNINKAKNRQMNKAQIGRVRHNLRTKKDTKVVSVALSEGYTRKFSKPIMKTLKDGIRVSHKEYVGTITASTDLSYAKLRINPADPATFPWLSTMAGSYEKFKIVAMKIHYQKNCATVTPGFVYIYPDYNVEREAMTTPELFLNTMDVKETSPWVSCQVDVIAKKLNQTMTYLIRSPYETYTNYLLYDPLNVYIGTAESQSNDPNNIGRIFIEYVIDLMIPDPESQLKLYSLDAHTDNTSNLSIPAGGYLPNYAGSTPNINRGNLNMGYSSAGLTFPDSFSGMLTTYFIAAGIGAFDDTRQPFFQISNGTLSIDGFCLRDISGGTDVWSVTYWIQAAKGSVLSFAATSSMVTANNFVVTSYFQFASANPRWLNTPDPRAFPTFSMASHSLNKPPTPIERSYTFMEHYRKLSKKKKTFEIIEDSD
jgi:hypothetical protein